MKMTVSDVQAATELLQISKVQNDRDSQIPCMAGEGFISLDQG